MSSAPAYSAHRRRRRPKSNARPSRPSAHNHPEPAAVERKPSANAIPESELEGVFTTLEPKLKRALAEMGFKTPTPIQEQSIPGLVEGRDMIGCAQTGTGKTAAFGLPLLQRLSAKSDKVRPSHPRALILAPTRELAAQIGETLADCARFTGLRSTVIFGGVGKGPQISALRRGVDVLVATPGRLLDHMNERDVHLDEVEVFVLDEADRMLDMGFLPDIRRVLAALPKKRQSELFSATMPAPIRTLSRDILTNPAEVSIEPDTPAVEAIRQEVRFVDKGAKVDALKALLGDSTEDRVIVFTRMKHVANRVAEGLERTGVRAAAIHGNKSQAARTRAMDGFRAGRIRVLVATDIAARGIDVPDVTHVVNYDLPEEAETYVHRIGRTARAGKRGCAISFCEAEERGYLQSIERFIRKVIPVELDHKHHSDTAKNADPNTAKPVRGGRGGRGGGGGRRDNSRSSSRGSSGGGGGGGRFSQRRGRR